MNRREFLKTVLAAAALSTITPGVVAERVARAAEESGELPWPFTVVDVEETLKRGHLGYYVFHCAGGAFWAFASQYAEKVGGIWRLLPVPSLEEVRDAALRKKHLQTLMQFGMGGVVGYASLCGAINGALFVVQVVAGVEKIYKELGKIVLRTYEIMPFPSDYSNKLAVEGRLYVPKNKMKYPGPLRGSAAHSVLCHVSVSKWCIETGFASGSAARSERCGRLTADVAAYTAVLLNALYEAASELGVIRDNRIVVEEAEAKASSILSRVRAKISEWAGEGGIRGYYASWLIKGFKLSATTMSCRTCHYKGKDYELGQFTRGYMQCETCHKDMTPHAHYMIQVPQTSAHHQAAVSEFNRTAPLFTGIMGVIAGVVAGAALAKKREK